MTRESRTLAGIVLVVIPTVMFGGAALLAHLVGRMPRWRLAAGQRRRQKLGR